MGIKKILVKNGTTIPFDLGRMAKLVYETALKVEGVDTEVAYNIVKNVEQELIESGIDIPSIANINRKISNKLIELNYLKANEEYLSNLNNEVDSFKDRIVDTLDEITHLDAEDSDIKRENANINGDSSMGVMLKYGSETAKIYNLNKVIPKHIAEAHIIGDMHMHDLDFYTLTETCCQIDLEKLFKGGFNTGHGHLREPNAITSYTALAAIAIQANQNDMHKQLHC